MAEKVVWVRLYSRPGCGLCVPVEQMLARLAGEGLIRWERINIEGDPALLARFGETIPAVALEGGPLFEGRISEYRLRQALQAMNEG
jgi:hypothetical protein